MRINKSKVIFLTVALIIALLSSDIIGTEKVFAEASNGGWHLVETKYLPSSMDISILGGTFYRGAGLYDTHKGEGTEGNMTISHSRKTSNGGHVAHINYQVTWDTPPAYLAPEAKTGFNVEMKVLDYASWSSLYNISAHFDSGELTSADFATSSAIGFQSDIGETHIINTNTYFESSKVIPEGKVGDKKAIWLNLGDNYGYCYMYEWKEGISTAAAASDTPVLNGEWNINANNSHGKINIVNQTGTQFSGTVHIDSGRTEQLINGNISDNKVTFTRMWSSGALRQDYTGELTIDSNGKATVSGTFTQNGSGSYKWTAEKVDLIGTSTIRSDPPSAEVVTGGATSEAFESGARVSWNPTNGLGYRMFRSTSKGSLGISVTDFYITSTSYADVNVEPETTYYYTVKPVLAEARPFDGIDEKLGETIATFTITTGNKIYKPGSFKHFIMLKLDSPNMSVDGASQEVDPGRGTAPITISGRTMVPIRAVVEAMGGTVEWDGVTQKVTLKARGNIVEMWLGKTDITINGVSKKMDVAPASKNGRTFVPVRFAAENLNCKVDWINSTKEAVIVYEE